MSASHPSKKRWGVVGIAAYGIPMVLLYLAVWGPSQSTLRQTETQAEMLEAYRALRKIQETVAALELRWIQGDVYRTVKRRLTKVADQTGVRLMSVDHLQSEEVGGSIQRFPFKVRVRGGYHRIGAFLSALEGSPTLFVIGDLEIREGITGKRTHEAQCMLYAFSTALNDSIQKGGVQP